MLSFWAHAVKVVSTQTAQVFSDKGFCFTQNAVGFSNTCSPISIKFFYPYYIFLINWMICFIF